MFHFDITCEDVRLIANEVSPTSVRVTLYDNLSGKSHLLQSVSFCDFEKMVSGMICCHGDVPAESYPALEEILKGCPNECRPIP